ILLRFCKGLDRPHCDHFQGAFLILRYLTVVPAGVVAATAQVGVPIPGILLGVGDPRDPPPGRVRPCRDDGFQRDPLVLKCLVTGLDQSFTFYYHFYLILLISSLLLPLLRRSLLLQGLGIRPGPGLGLEDPFLAEFEFCHFYLILL